MQGLRLEFFMVTVSNSFIERLPATEDSGQPIASPSVSHKSYRQNKSKLSQDITYKDF